METVPAPEKHPRARALKGYPDLASFTHQLGESETLISETTCYLSVALHNEADNTSSFPVFRQTSYKSGRCRKQESQKGYRPDFNVHVR